MMYRINPFFYTEGMGAGEKKGIFDAKELQVTKGCVLLN